MRLPALIALLAASCATTPPVERLAYIEVAGMVQQLGIT